MSKYGRPDKIAPELFRSFIPARDIHLRVHAAIAGDRANVTHRTINTDPVDQVVRVLLHRKRITQRDRIDFQECTVFQEIVANLLFALDVVELAVSVFQTFRLPCPWMP